ncbi:MAG: thioredoxin-disulfide reductase [Candidatus Cloacimonadales bacterium]
MKTNHYDAIILGAGAAGLTAGIYLSRAHKKTLIINEGSIGGQMVLTHAVANYPGVPESSGREISLLMQQQAKEFGCDFETNVEVTKLELRSKKKMVEIDDDEIFSADLVIVATGGTPRKLGVPGEEKFKGRGVSYCATCDGDFYTGKDIVVTGGGNSALEEAVSLTEYANSVTIVHQFDHFQATQHAIAQAKKNPKISFIMESEIIEFIGDTNVKSIKLKNMKTNEISELASDGVFIYIGYVPNSKQFSERLDLSTANEIITDADMQTNIAGVFAAGDVRQKRFRQITTAVADGTIAALSAIEFLQK